MIIVPIFFFARAADETKPLVKTVCKPAPKSLSWVPCFVTHCPITNQVEGKIQTYIR